VSLGSKLLVLLLAFGVTPLLIVITVGYTVSRGAILGQAHQALESIAEAQAIHFTTELSRERLLLQTIAGQLPEVGSLEIMSRQQLSDLLVRSLPENGVFDGLRLAMPDGRVLASVALRQSAPHWPSVAPAADWDGASVVVHRDGERVLAYLVAAPVSSDRIAWLEGHVREADFRRIFSVPEHLLAGVESAVFERDGQPIFGVHDHAARDLAALVGAIGLDSAGSHPGTRAGRSLISVAPISESGWTFVATLPIEFALAPLSRLRTSATLGAILLVFVIAVTGIVASRSVTNPLREVAEAASRLGRAEQFTPLPAHSADEVGMLIDSFNAMAANLNRSRLEVERLHARDMERAQQLATVGELASGVAHEIRNPLTGVRGAIELALRTIPEGDPSRSLLAEAQQQLNRIEGTTSQLLQYARPPALKEITVDANLLVERAAAIVAPRAAAVGVEIHLELSQTPVNVRVDSELMVQVMVNLLLNGIQAMVSGGPLTIWVARHAPEVWIGVRDAGPGVSPDHRPDIFRPFFTTKHQGTGLGLPISKEIVSRHGGTLTLEDNHEGGATFVVALPMSDTRRDAGE